MKLLKHQRIDGGGDPQWEHNSHRSLAYSMLWGIANRGSFIHNEDGDENLPQGYRIGTWVEKRSSKLGYAFGLSRTRQIANTAAFVIHGRFFVVDREHEQVVEPPKTLTVHTDTDIHEQVDRAIAVYDRQEMITAINIMGKMKSTILERNGQGHLDMHVGHGLVLASLDELASSFPQPGVVN